MKNLINTIKTMDKKTLCRTILQFLAYINQIIAILGQTSWADSPVYQWVSIGITIAITTVSWWENNDVTGYAKLGTKVLDALKAGTITEEEVLSLFADDE